MQDHNGIIALAGFAFFYCLGGCHGLLMAWTQPARMRRWARRVDIAAERVVELIDTDDTTTPNRRMPL